MISFRYHIVSLVAVFFAMAIGVLIGTNVIADQLVNSLRSQRNHNRAELSAERERTSALRAELAVWERMAKSTLEPKMRGKLNGRTVVVLTPVGECCPAAFSDGIADAVERAGAVIGGRISFTARWQLVEEADRVDLARAVGSKETEAQSLVESAARTLSARLRSTSQTHTPDVLDDLEQAGFIKASMADGDVTSRRAAFVYVQPGGSDVVPRGDQFGLSLVKALATESHVAVVEPVRAKESLTARVVADEDARSRIATIDHIDTEPGIYSLVIGLSDLFAGRVPSHYGVGKGTTGVIPPQ